VVDQAPETLPKAVRGTPLDTDEGEAVPAQQPSGPEVRQGGGEWPDPDTAAQAPAPGAVDADDEDDASPAGPASSDDRINRLVERARALAGEDTSEADAAAELHAAAGGDSELLTGAEQVCARDKGDAAASRAAAHLAAARSI
jgi:hypothetical protein